MMFRDEMFVNKRRGPLFTLGLLLAVPVMAHHSFSMFDFKKRTTLEGTVTQFIWSNPHSFVELDVLGNDGGTVHYSIESSSPNILTRLGWKHNLMRPGDKVRLVMFPLRNGENGGALQSVTLPDGRTCRTSLDANEQGEFTNPTDIGNC